MESGKWMIAGLVIVSVVVTSPTNEAEEPSDTCVWVGVEVNLDCKHNRSGSCEAPEKPLYGGYDNTINGNIYKTGDSIRYYCHRGYRLIGQSNRICTGTHKGWRPHEPYCEPEYIGNLMRRLDGIEDKLINVIERRTTVENHTLETAAKISAFDNKISAIGKNVSALDNTVMAMDKRISAVDKNASDIGSTISATNSRMSAIDEIVSIMNSTISSMINQMAALESKVSANDNKISAIDNKVSAIDNKVSAVDNKVSAVDNKLSAIDIKVSAVDNKMLGVDKVLSNTESGVPSLDLSLSLLGSYNCSVDQIKERLIACTNGSNPSSAEVVSKCLTMQSGVRNGLKVSEYKWILKDFTSKVKQTDWTPYYSPPFYQTVPGYKFMLRGDIDNDSEIRIYLYLLPGEYDHLLTWPIIKIADLTILLNNGTEILHRKINNANTDCGLNRPTYPSGFLCHTAGPDWRDDWKNKEHISKDDTAVIKLYMYA